VTHVPRSVYEFGDPVHEQITREERTDHHHATARGQRVLLIADSLVSVLDASGLLTDPAAARREAFHVLADHLYGVQALDIPDFSSEKSLEALRQGRASV
jgi:hypothetical protein